MERSSNYDRITKRRFKRCDDLVKRIFKLKRTLNAYFKKHKITNPDKPQGRFKNYILSQKILLESLREELRLYKKLYYKHKFKKMAVKRKKVVKPSAESEAPAKKAATKKVVAKEEKPAKKAKSSTKYDYPEGMDAAERKKYRIKMRSMLNGDSKPAKKKKVSKEESEDAPVETTEKKAAKKKVVKKVVKKKAATKSDDELDD